MRRALALTAVAAAAGWLVGDRGHLRRTRAERLRVQREALAMLRAPLDRLAEHDPRDRVYVFDPKGWAASDAEPLQSYVDRIDADMRHLASVTALPPLVDPFLRDRDTPTDEPLAHLHLDADGTARLGALAWHDDRLREHDLQAMVDKINETARMVADVGAHGTFPQPVPEPDLSPMGEWDPGYEPDPDDTHDEGRLAALERDAHERIVRGLRT